MLLPRYKSSTASATQPAFDLTATTTKDEQGGVTPYCSERASISNAVQRSNKYRRRTKWTARTCSVLTVAVLRHRLLPRDDNVWMVPSLSAIFCLPLPAMALMEILLHTGFHLLIPLSGGRKVEIVPQLLPNDAETAWYFEGADAWPCQRKAVSRWFNEIRRGRRRGRKCFAGSGFAIAAGYSCFVLLCGVWTWVDIVRGLRCRM